jgi:HD-GYP domain-containing protein (c-di-GMP phosphodiesterase class II)
VVQNHFQETPDGAAFPSIHEYIVLPVSKNDRLHGWLVVLNRNRNGASQFNYFWQEMRLEFGTVEAAVARTAAAMLASHAQNVELFRHKEQLLTDMVRALVNAIEAKDEYTRGHSERVALFALRLGREVGFDEEACERLYLTGMLHDVGKIAVDDATLRKPDRLNSDEFANIKTHPDSGWAILQGLEHLRYVLPGVLHHHEKYDGSGYPDGLVGKDIPMDARILAVCDAYDAMTSDRTYRQGMPQEKAERILREAAGSHWDPEIVDAFFLVMPDIVEIRQTYQLRPYQTRTSARGAAQN